jgi:hypothetical protein
MNSTEICRKISDPYPKTIVSGWPLISSIPAMSRKTDVHIDLACLQEWNPEPTF